MGCLKTTYRFFIVLQCFGLVHKCFHPAVFVLVRRIYVGIVTHDTPVRSRVGEIGGCRTLGKPQAGISSLIAVAATPEILDCHAERILVFYPLVYFGTRPETQTVFPVFIDIVYQRPGIVAHTETKAETVFFVSSVHRQGIFLIKACLVQQIFGALEIIELRRSHVRAQLRFERDVQASAITALFRKNLNHPVCRVRPVQRSGGSSGNIFDMIDILHRNITDRTAHCSVPVQRIVQCRTGIHVVHTHAVHIDYGSGCRIGRRKTPRLDQRGRSRLAVGHGYLHIRKCILQHLVHTPMRHLFQFYSVHSSYIGGQAPSGYFGALAGNHHFVQSEVVLVHLYDQGPCRRIKGHLACFVT